MNSYPKSKSVVFLTPPDGKGKRVLDILFRDTDFCERNDLSVVLSSSDHQEYYKKRGIEAVVTNNVANPVDAIDEVVDDPEYIVACGWPAKIDSETLNFPTKAALNCHSSYLPDYKGQSVYRVQWAHAEENGGATIHHMTEELDEGRIVCRQQFHISLFDTPFDIMQRYTELTAALVRESILLTDTGYEGRDHAGGRYYSKISWKKTIAYGIINHILRGIGLDKRLKILPQR
ncbi:formyltransferase family protein [Natrarchaeobius oligotrophus]|uniref:phosphoribosylglycinamide formyltransferase 1 n=1 Tax=Natrarchaeobius chitinivorans TaxID=1679083 RepID=A0A3N6MJX2_NATCH|nr:formyltransferase family protein [Natrarchaeobius chitinivorans]RQG96181.1 hypothetical protein EA472_20865 [Natrarchaeobius chitinivorans]